MKLKIIIASSFLALGAVAAHAQTGPVYATPDLILSFENPTGNDVEFNLGTVTALSTTGTIDFGNFSSYITGAGQTVGTTLWSVAADAGGQTRGVPSNNPYTSRVAGVTTLPGAIILTENDGLTPSAIGSSYITLSNVETAIRSVGVDISFNPALAVSGLGASGVSVSATGDTISYTSQSSYGNISSELEGTGPGSSQVYVLTSTTPGTGSHNPEGPLATATDIGTMTLSSGGELTFAGVSAIPEPSTYGAILGVLAIGFVAIRRRLRVVSA
jgi:hypothetical protein